MRVNLLVYRFRHLVIELNVSAALGGRLLTPFSLLLNANTEPIMRNFNQRSIEIKARPLNKNNERNKNFIYLTTATSPINAI